MIVDVLMPKMGESITEGTIVEWKKNVGDMIEKDETLLEISTDKVDSEIPCPTAGKVLELLFDKNATVEVNTIIARIGTDASDKLDSSQDNASKEEVVVEESKNKPVQKNESNKEDRIEIKNEKKENRIFFSPLVKSIAQKEGISIEELQNIQGSGSGGRVNKSDILNYIENKSNIITQPASSEPIATSTDYSIHNLKDSP